MGEGFSTKGLFEYRRSHKLRFAIVTYSILVLVGLFAASYYFFLRHEEIAFFEFFRRIITHISTAISADTLEGVLYASFFGGLFFVTIPMEVVFVSFLRGGVNPYLLVALFLTGFAVSFTINYVIGMKLDTLSKRMIDPKKFYKIKGILNRHGAVAVFAINAIPFLPSQPLSTVLGVFRYNKAKFYVYFLAGQLVKFAAIATIYIYIIGVPGVSV